MRFISSVVAAAILLKAQLGICQQQQQLQLLVIRPIADDKLLKIYLVGVDASKDSRVVKGDDRVQTFKEAFTCLQFLLDAKEDSLWLVSEKKKERWTSTKREANRLLGQLGADGKKIYEQVYGGQAAEALSIAKKSMSQSRLSEVAWRYCHTRAGGEAQLWLAGLAFGSYASAGPGSTLRGTIMAVEKADVWPTPTPGLAYVKFHPDRQLWLKSDADEKKRRARLPLKKGYWVDCSFGDVKIGMPALYASADAVIIVHTP